MFLVLETIITTSLTPLTKNKKVFGLNLLLYFENLWIDIYIGLQFITLQYQNLLFYYINDMNC